MEIVKNKLVIFGAGKIGRSFIAQLFSQAGYAAVFVDINKEVIDALNQRGSYEVVLKSIKDEVIKPVFTKEILNEKSFSELIMIAKEKKIKIEPRTKKDALIQQILDIEKGDI